MNTILKRVISMMLCFVLVAGYLPVGAFATENGETVATEATEMTTEPTQEASEETEAPSESTEATEPEVIPVTGGEGETTSDDGIMLADLEDEIATIANDVDARTAVFCSDVHGSTSDLSATFSVIGNKGIYPTVVGFNGDTCLPMETVSSTVNSALTCEPTIVYSYAASHDADENSCDISTVWNFSGQAFSNSYFYVYTIRETDMQTTSAASTAAAAFTSWVATADTTKPVFIISHRPLHNGRNDNNGASEWIDDLLAAGKKMDIVFFWGHNHTSETQNKTTAVDQAAYYVPNDGSETITVANNGGTTGLNFTYMNAGYINANNQKPARIGVATTVKVTDTHLVFQDYDNSGEFTGTYSHNVSVEREHETAPKTLTSIAVTTQPTTTTYNVGDTFSADGLVVTATYSDGTSAVVTGYTLSDVDMTTAGTKTVTVTYQGKTATFDIVVYNTFYSEDTFAAVTAAATGATLENVESDAAAAKLSFYYGFNISLTEQAANTSATVTFWLDPEAMTSSNFAVYYLNETTGEYEAFTNYTLDKDEYDVEYITITDAAMGTYIYGTPTPDDVIPEGAALSKLTLSGPNKTKYFLEEDLENDRVYLNIDGLVVKAVYNLEGDETDYTKTLSWNQFDETYDGYALTFGDLTVPGEKTVTVSYGGVSTTFNVWVCAETAASGDVSFTFAEPGVVAVAVETAEADETIATAVADVIKGDVVVYNIIPTYANGDTALTGEAYVTLPIPSGVTNPVVYYVSDDGIEKMPTADNGDSTLTFTTTHFSTFVVGESSMVGKDEDATVDGSTTTKTEEKTVYVKVDAPVSGEQYLIVSTGTAGTAGYVLGGSSVTPVSGTLTVNGTDGTYTYIESAGTLWTASGSNSSWTFANGSNYLGYTQSSSGNEYFGGLTYSYAVNTAANSTTWTLNNNQLYIYLQASAAGSIYGGSDSSNNYYLTGGSSWSMSSTTANVYFYKPVTATVTTESGTQTATYGMYITYPDSTGTYVDTQQAITAAFIKADETLQLGAAFTSTVDGQTPPSDGTWNITSSNTNVATVDNNGLVTFKGNEGETLIQATYTWTENGQSYSVSNYVAIAVTTVIYDVEISEDGTNAAADTIAVRNVKSGVTKQLSYLLTRQTSENTTEPANATKTTWYVYKEDGSDASSIVSYDQTGKLTFTGVEGTIKVMVACEVGGKTVNDIITINVRQSNAVTPEESTTDFPRWPNAGAVRFDKTASAVGNFSETGIAQVELSLAGIPTGGAKPFDVVLMLDMSQSMNQSSRKTYTIDAARAFLETICLDEDGNWNELQHGISICSYNIDPQTDYPTNTTTSVFTDDMVDVTSYDIYSAADTAIANMSLSNGTDYAEALKHAYNILNATKDPERQQYLIFMTDGKPTSYAYLATSQVITSSSYHSFSTIATNVYTDGDDVYNAYLADQGTTTGSKTELNTSTLKNYDEYYSYLMKKNGVEIYSVGLAVEEDDDKTVLSHISSAEATEGTTSDNSHAYFISDGNSDALTAAFKSMGESMMSAATNVKVEDAIADKYDIIFELPDNFSTEEATKAGLADQEFYIEVLEYELDQTSHERTGAATVKQRIYLGTNADTGAVEITKIMTGTIAADGTETLTETTITPVYTVAAEGQDAYYDDSGKYYPEGNGTHHLSSGAFVVTDEDGNLTQLHTANFAYDAVSEILTWTVTSMSMTAETALRYFVYLENSGGVDAKTENPIEAGTYPTNKYATLTYTNFKGNECEQIFPVPQMTWNGAQVHYVFYLVNENGVPVNRAGREVTFAEAVFVTDIHHYSITWNDLEQAVGLEAERVALDLLPSDYTLYDPSASYNIHVYEDETGSNLNNHFIIDGTDGDTTTYVYNNKTDVKKYNVHGTYAANSTYLCKSYSVTATFNDDGSIASASYTKMDGETQVVPNSTSGVDYTDEDGYVYYIDENGDVYTIVQKTDATEAYEGFDFANTTVAFAVEWTKSLTSDTVVVDFGLPVDIDVTSNDFVYNYITGIGASQPDKAINTALYDTAYLTATETVIGNHYIKKQDENHIRFIPGYGSSMEFNAPITFYYESTVEAYENGAVKKYFAYSSVTVIPATTVYYEDSFLTLTGSGTTWTKGSSTNATQAQDRPGTSQISKELDADNAYGYDAAYKTMSTHSMGSAASVHVDADSYATATFSFYGTGFDVISMTSNATGMLAVEVKDANGNRLKREIVDTYYGMLENGTLSDNSPEAIYQVPVIKISGLTYGKYEVILTATYNEYFDHTSADGYDLYLDAIRIYDPTGNEDETANKAYAADGEAYPVYEELRDNVISAEGVTYTEDENGNVTVNFPTEDTFVKGAIFIDANDASNSIAEYFSYGPNNELYLAKGQAIAFNYDVTETMADVQLGIKAANGGTVTYEINGDSYTTESATDLYYSILDYAKAGTVIIENVSGGILSLTNIKTTFKNAAATTSMLWMDGESAGYALMSLRAPTIEEEPEVTEPETTVPETTEPETTEPETTEPEVTEPETTEPETTEPEEEESESVLETITNIVSSIVNAISNFFSKWFR